MRIRTGKTVAAACVLMILSGSFVVMGTAPALAPPVPFAWESTGGGSGFGQVMEFAYDAANDVLYAGTWGYGVWRCDEPGSPVSAWTDTHIDATANYVYSLAYDSVNGVLYAGTTKGLWRCTDPMNASWHGAGLLAFSYWQQPFGAVYGCRIDALAYDTVHDALYAGWYDGASMVHMGVWRCDAPREETLAWTNINAGAPVAGYRIECFAYDGSRNLLYAGCTVETSSPPAENGKGVWRCSSPDSAPSWTDTGTGTIDSTIVNSLALDQLGGFLYAATRGFGVWRCDAPGASPSWTDIGGGFGTSNVKAVAYDPNNCVLYAGGWDGSGVKQCLMPGSDPTWELTGGAIGSFDVGALALDPVRRVLYADCMENSGCTDKDVYRAPVEPGSEWYFAEGYTGPGFQEYLCLGNPTASDIHASVTFLFKDGSSEHALYTVPAKSRHTVDVNGAVGPDREVSMYIMSSAANLIAERPMYFDYTAGDVSWTGGHDAVGASAPSDTWYFAEGYTGAGFDEYVCVLNPGDTDADLTFRFQTQEAGEVVVRGKTVPAHSRDTFLANQLLEGKTHETSLKLESSVPVVAERPMYFDYLGANPAEPRHWNGGHCVMGATQLTKEYFFAEGYTGAGFDEYLTMQNHHDAAISVDAVYQLGPGQGGPVNRTYSVPARGRKTVNVNGPEGVGPGVDNSVRLTCAQDFLAERPMYFDYSGMGGWSWTGGHCVIGAGGGADTWFFAEGYTGTGFEQWLCIQNPGTADATVTITYYPEAGTLIGKAPITVPAGTRKTVYVNGPEGAGPGLSISAEVASTQPVIVERPMYFNFGGVWTGGHDVVGYAP